MEGSSASNGLREAEIEMGGAGKLPNEKIAVRILGSKGSADCRS